MKKKLLLMALVAIFATLAIHAQTWTEKTFSHGDSTVVVSGVVKDKRTRKVIANASIVLKETQISTVTNSEGVFSLKMPQSAVRKSIEVSHIGYSSSLIQKLQTGGPITVLLSPKTLMLDEVLVLSGNPREIVEQAINKIPENYPDRNNLLSAFYRETLQKGRRYTSISEGFVNILKTPYKWRSIKGENVQVMRGRQLMSQKTSDTLAVKFMGGPLLGMQADMVKNPDLLFDADELDFYEFTMELSEYLDDRRQFVISFRPVVRLEYPLHTGRLFIDTETLAFTRVEFQMYMGDKLEKEKVSNIILKKKPFGLRFSPSEVAFVVSYRQNGDRYVLNYIRNEMRFKCDWKRRLFSSNYTLRTEIAVVDNDENPAEVIRRKNAFTGSQVFADIVETYWDEDFWRDYNIIEPTESLEKAVRNLRKNQ